jgi:hypothetical protein
MSAANLNMHPNDLEYMNLYDVDPSWNPVLLFAL